MGRYLGKNGLGDEGVQVLAGIAYRLSYLEICSYGAMKRSVILDLKGQSAWRNWAIWRICQFLITRLTILECVD
jgi:hypothetical protein